MLKPAFIKTRAPIFSKRKSMRLRPFCPQGASHFVLMLALTVQQKEASSASAGNLAADCTQLPRQFITLVNKWVRNAIGKPLLLLPVLVQEFAISSQVAAFQN